MTDLMTGTYAYTDRPAGRHQLSATASMFPGVSQHDLTAVSGRTYFFLTRPSARAKAPARNVDRRRRGGAAGRFGHHVQ